MVSLHSILALGGVPLAAAATEPPETMPPTMRAAVLMALLGIALVGLLLVAAILLGGNWVRRQGRHRRGTAVPPDRTPLLHEGSRSKSLHDRLAIDEEAPEP